MHCPLFFAFFILLRCSVAYEELFTDIDPGSYLGAPKWTYCQAPKPDNLTYTTPDMKGIELKHVVVIVRHGDRTPISDLGVAGNELKKWAGLVDVDELKQDLPGSIKAEQAGLLTRRGQKQLESLGASLRQIYVDRLGAVPAVFDEDSVSLRSTNFSRTFLSTKHLISGFYPGTHPAVFLDKIRVQPHRNGHAVSVDPLLVQDAVCKRLQAIAKSSQQAPSLAGMHEEMRMLLALAKDRWKLKQLKSFLAVGQPKMVPRQPESDGFFEIADVFFCRTCHPSDESFVDEETEGLGGRFVQLSHESWRIFQAVLVANPQHSRLRSGPLVSELLEHMADTIDDNKGGRLMVLGAHDTTLAHLHGALGSGMHGWPAYAANMIFELWMGNAGAYVRALWNGQAIRFPWASGELVPWGEFVAYTHHLLPVDLAAECLV